MATSYSWHTGAECIAGPRVITVPLLPDEILSSWIVRTALFQGCDPLTLTGVLWPKWRAWIRDIDRGLDNERLLALAGASGIASVALHAATLQPIISSVSIWPAKSRTFWPWILALGSRNRKRFGGLQYCPSCLAEDRKPYFRIQWRLAWHTCCELHGTSLLDKCGKCGAPLEPHLLSAVDENIALCATCKCDLRNAMAPALSKDALNFQRAADSAVKSGRERYGETVCSSADWFALSRYFAALLRKAASGRADKLAAMLGILGVDMETLTPPLTGLALEMLPVNERAMLSGGMWRMISAGPEDYIASARKASVTRSALQDGREYLPSCVESIVRVLTDKNVHKARKKTRVLVSKRRSKQNVLRMWARLQRRIQVTAK